MISIILPNLNTPLLFLKERLDTILQQTYQNWECIVIDGYSDNGSWEFIKNKVEDDFRFSLTQLPRKGIYNAWNEGINRAHGKYIYIATSDDTMSPWLLERMSNALNTNPDCGLAHCCLTIIDERGGAYNGTSWENYWTSQYFGALLNKKHKRLAPHDGLLHMGVLTVYTSVTQLLIRKQVFDDIGFFLTDAGAMADFEWGMRISLLTNVIHIPEKLATWRIHSLQATSESYNNSSEHRKKLVQLADHAFSVFKLKNSKLAQKLNVRILYHVFWRDQLYFELKEEKSVSKKVRLLFRWGWLHLPVLIDYVISKLKIRKQSFDRVKYIKKYLKKIKLDGNIIIIE